MLSLLGWLGNASQAPAAHYRSAGLVGMMLQPSSQYYHSVYGGQTTVSSQKDGFHLRLQYVQRPPFRASGYQDQEQGASILVGSSLKKYGLLSLIGFMGYGGMQGSVREYASARTRRYNVDGVSACIVLELLSGPFSVALTHQSLIGFDGPEQTEALVAWPYSFFFLELGVFL